MRAALVLAAFLALAAGCVESPLPASHCASACALQPSPSLGTAAPSSTPAASVCGGDGLVNLTVHAWRDRIGRPMGVQTVGAVKAGSPTPDDVTFDLDPRYNGYARAHNQTDGNGTARLRVPEQSRLDVYGGADLSLHARQLGVDVGCGRSVDLFFYNNTAAPKQECGRPKVPSFVPNGEQYATDLVPVHIHVSKHRPGDSPVPKVRVGALDPASPPPFSVVSIDRFFTTCSLAFTPADQNGTATLLLHRGESFMPMPEGFRWPTRRPTYTAQPNLSVDLAYHEEGDAAIGDCGERHAPFGFPADEQFAKGLVPVTLAVVSPGGLPAPDVHVAALAPNSTLPLDVFKVERFFTDCVLGEGHTDSRGEAVLWLADGQAFTATAGEDRQDGTATFGLRATAGERVVLAQRGGQATFTATVHVDAAAVRTRIQLGDDNQTRQALAAAESASVSAKWANAPTAWADLKLALSAGDGAAFASTDAPQVPAASAQEKLDAGLGDNRCDAAERGLFVVLGPSGATQLQSAVDVTVTVTVSIGNDPAFDPNAGAPCA